MKNLVLPVLLVLIVLAYLLLVLLTELELKSTLEQPRPSISQLFDASSRIRTLSSIRTGLFLLAIMLPLFIRKRRARQ